MGNESILVVEDESDIAELIRYNLTKEGYRVACAETGEQALNSARRERPDLVLLDLMLPGVDGLEVCRRLSTDEQTRSIPIIMVTARGEEADVVAGLELGAADYVTKPFSPRILTARVRSVMRRRARASETPQDEPIRLEGLEIDPRRHRVAVDGTPIDLTATEFKILAFLARRPGWVFTRYQIVDGIRGPDYPVTERAIDVQIVALRRKLGSAAELIQTVRGVGYRFKE